MCVLNAEQLLLHQRAPFPRLFFFSIIFSSSLPPPLHPKLEVEAHVVRVIAGIADVENTAFLPPYNNRQYTSIYFFVLLHSFVFYYLFFRVLVCAHGKLPQPLG